MSWAVCSGACEEEYAQAGLYPTSVRSPESDFREAENE